MTLLLALASHFSAYHQDVQAGRWSRSPLFTFLDYPYVELAGKCLGIVGFGAIGQRVKALAEAFDMRVLVAERPGQAPRPGRLLFEQVLKSCDVLTLHCPLNEATCDLIDAAALAQMRPGSWLINVSRGGIVNESALVAALNSGHLAGAALDVLSQEPPPEDNPLLQAKHPNLLLTPHIAWASRESRARLVDELALNLQAFLQGRPRNQVA
jgi:glycerate dehydrogenase